MNRYTLCAERLLLLSLCGFCCCTLRGDGLPEPGLVMYGAVTNSYGGGSARLTSGTLPWTIQPAAGGAAITLTNDLANLNKPLPPVAADVRRLTSCKGLRRPIACFDAERDWATLQRS
jgi:hypothetical protein